MISVCIPALNEAETIGAICQEIREELMEPNGNLVSDLVVVDGGSQDDTPAIAEKAGARVVGPPTKSGKGAALYQSILETSTEIVVWCDGDLTSFEKSYVEKLAEPLLTDASCQLVKGYYENRKLGDFETGGGRTTWLMARPVLSLFFPDLAHIREPLSGEYAIRRTAAEKVPFITGYGVELGLLVDVAKTFGVKAIAEVNLGNRSHKNRPLEELSIQSAEILHTALYKAGVELQKEWSSLLVRPNIKESDTKANVEIQIEECPPIKP